MLERHAVIIRCHESHRFRSSFAVNAAARQRRDHARRALVSNVARPQPQYECGPICGGNKSLNNCQSMIVHGFPNSLVTQKEPCLRDTGRITLTREVPEKPPVGQDMPHRISPMRAAQGRMIPYSWAFRVRETRLQVSSIRGENFRFALLSRLEITTLK